MSRLLRVLDENIRVLPVLILAAGFLMFLKSADLWTAVQEELIGIDTAMAVGTPASTEEHSAPEEGHEEPAHGEPAQEEHPEYDPGENLNYIDMSGMGLSREEIQVLESLSERRSALEERERELATRERLIEAVERRTEERIEELRSLQAQIEDLLIQRDEDEEAQMASLVGVYETMRAKDAARIFERLDTEILVDVTSRMREARIAPILAEMDPAAAQDLTVLLATRLDIPGTE